MSSYQVWKAREAEVAKRNPKLAAAHHAAHAALISAEHARSAKGRTPATERAVEKARKERAELRALILAAEAKPEPKAATPSPAPRKAAAKKAPAKKAVAK